MVETIDSGNTSTGANIESGIADFLLKKISDLVKIPVDEIHATDSFEQLGFDSLMVTGLTNRLEETFSSLPKTLFFEYQNTQDLAGYFVGAFGEKLYDLLKITPDSKDASGDQPAVVAGPSAPSPLSNDGYELKEESSTTAASGGESLDAGVESYLKEQLSGVIKMPVEEIYSDDPGQCGRMVSVSLAVPGQDRRNRRSANSG